MTFARTRFPADIPMCAGMLTQGRILPVAMKTLDVPAGSLLKPVLACRAASKALSPVMVTFAAKFANGMERGSAGPPGGKVEDAALAHN